MKFHITLLFAFCILGSVFALYGANSKVVKLEKSTFDSLVIQSKELWLVEFFAPWCGHCKNLAPEWEKAAKALEGIVKIGAVDMTTDQEAGSRYNIQGFPTLKFFGENKSSPQDYEGGRTATDIVNYALAEAKKVALARLGVKSSGSSNKPKQENKPKEEKKEEEPEVESNGDVIILTDDDFDDLVMNSKEPWFIEFYAPWCGHCKSLQPEWNKLATDLKPEKINVAKVDSTVHSKVTQRFEVKGYPTIKFFPAGMTSDSEAIEFNGSRDSVGLGNFAKEERDKSRPIQFSQLLNQDIYDNFCSNHNGVCLLFFLPHIVDSSVEQRQSYLDVIQELATSHKRKPFTFLWSQGGDQYDFEEKLNASGSGFPSLLAVSYKKNVYSVFKGSFKLKELDSFLTKLVSGRVHFTPLPTLPKLENVDEWIAPQQDTQEGQQEAPQDPSVEQQVEL